MARTVRENDRKWVGDKDEERSRSSVVVEHLYPLCSHCARNTQNMSVGYRLGVGMGMATA